MTTFFVGFFGLYLSYFKAFVAMGVEEATKADEFLYFACVAKECIFLRWLLSLPSSSFTLYPKQFCFLVTGTQNSHKYTIALGEPEPLLVPW